MTWEAESTDQFGEWFESLDRLARASVVAAVEVQEEVRPALGRPVVDTLNRSRHPHMTELR